MSETAQRGARAGAAAEMLLGFVESSPELREAAIFDRSGAQLYATDGRDWEQRARRLWTAAEAGGQPARQIHVAGADGAVLAARGSAGTVIALADRFPLASLVLSDLRAVLRELESAGERR